MPNSEGGGAALTPQESWGVIHTTMDKARSSIYLAGSSMILLLWGALTAVSYFFEYWLQTGGSDLAEQSPWVRAPFYGTFIAVGIVGSAIIGRREATKNVSRDRQPGGRHSGFPFLDGSVVGGLVHSGGRGDVERRKGPPNTRRSHWNSCFGVHLVRLDDQPGVGGGRRWDSCRLLSSSLSGR